MNKLKNITALLFTAALFHGFMHHSFATSPPQEPANDTTAVELSFADERLIELFVSNVRQGNFEWALSIYDEIEYKDVLDLQSAYMRALERTGQHEGILEKYEERLKKWPDHKPFYEGALFHRARHKYTRAENRYQAEMRKYHQNENATTYALLRRELRNLSEDFRQVRDMALELREMNPRDRRYLLLLRNSYQRLNEPEKAEEINRMLEQN
ncbi:hypothetical protein [Natronoflexus pectinivorans]|uniref:Tetratricopeptide repeat protein n=1 Tax=Natronoflexus pectinivorans TaxID=682526 RepID=A0A4V2RWC1_9BACT|nr:hypothetical protein [Natronoflexus pectinivorans]TCO07725.1 hypothetical protein EV194_107109 [Natronoflexus pectinivorans]